MTGVGVSFGGICVVGVNSAEILQLISAHLVLGFAEIGNNEQTHIGQ